MTRPLPGKDIISADLQTSPNVEQLLNKFVPSPIIYQPKNEQKHIFLDQFIDEILRPSKSQLAKFQSNEGVSEETARIGRLLLASIPTPFIENFHDS